MKKPPYLEPWKITPGNPKLKHQKYVNIVGKLYRHSLGENVIVTVFGYDYAVHRKTAQLIATAPELLDALDDACEIIKRHEHCGGKQCKYCRIKLISNKARGIK